MILDILDKTLNLIKKLTFTLLHKFWLTLTQYSRFVYTP